MKVRDRHLGLRQNSLKLVWLTPGYLRSLLRSVSCAVRIGSNASLILPRGSTRDRFRSENMKAANTKTEASGWDPIFTQPP